MGEPLFKTPVAPAKGSVRFHTEGLHLACVPKGASVLCHLFLGVLYESGGLRLLSPLGLWQTLRVLRLRSTAVPTFAFLWKTVKK